MTVSGETIAYKLLNDEESVLSRLFSEISKAILEFVIGYFYFDQDGGCKSWSKGPVVQKLKNIKFQYRLYYRKLVI